MKEVPAYKCGYCHKLYDNQYSCKSHEYRCYFNPRTRSCASCAFLKLEKQVYKFGHTLRYQACLANIPICTEGLRTKCDKYLDTKYKEDSEIMDNVYESYDLEKQLFEAVAKYNFIEKQGGRVRKIDF